MRTIVVGDFNPGKYPSMSDGLDENPRFSYYPPMPREDLELHDYHGQHADNTLEKH